VLVVLLTFFVVEANYAPFTLYPAWEVPDAYHWLGEQEGDFAVAEFPVSPRGFGMFIRQVYGSIHHWKKLLVGYSGFQSKGNIELLKWLNDSFPGDKCLDELSQLDVKYVLVFEKRLTKDKYSLLQGQERLTERKRYGHFTIYELVQASGK
jgi:hypothetical protein